MKTSIKKLLSIIQRESKMSFDLQKFPISLKKCNKYQTRKIFAASTAKNFTI